MFEITVGIDIAKKKFDVARLQNGKYRHKVFPNTPAGFAAFAVWLAGFGPEPVLIALEATGAYGTPLAEFLVDQGFWVSVVNPAKIKAFAESELSRAKTDKADAQVIARFAKEKQPPRWTPPPPQIRELQALLRRVEQLSEMRQMERNRLETADPAAVPSIQTLLKTLERKSRPPATRFASVSMTTPISSTGGTSWIPSPASARLPSPISWCYSGP